MCASISEIKKAQKESLLFKEISKLYMQASMDDPRLAGIFINRVKLSPDKGHCTVYFYTPEGEEHFNNVLEILKLYKPSLRKALATGIKARYTPEIVFKFDKTFEKQNRLEELLNTIKENKKGEEE
jgi:ribosome-binding factor A